MGLINVLIIGSKGLIGSSILKNLDYSVYRVYQTSRYPKGPELFCDVLDYKSILKCFELVNPSIVINTSNLSGGVNFCEENEIESYNFHFKSNTDIGSLCIKYNSTFVFISTDYVFDGLNNKPVSENDKLNPLNIYGKHKLFAENWIKKHIKKHIIARTTNVYGWDPKTKTPNFLMHLFFKLSKNKNVTIPSYLYGNPTYAYTLAQSIIELLSKKIYGTFHLVGDSYVSRYNWALEFCKLFNFDKNLINKVSNPPKNDIPRPLKSNLKNNKYKKYCDTRLLSLEEGLKLFKIDATFSK